MASVTSRYYAICIGERPLGICDSPQDIPSIIESNRSLYDGCEVISFSFKGIPSSDEDLQWLAETARMIQLRGIEVAKVEAYG